MFIEIGHLQGLVAPDPNKPLTFDSLVEQYRVQAIAACKSKDWPESNWRMLAEIWSGVDMDILSDLRTVYPEKSERELLQMIGVV